MNETNLIKTLLYHYRLYSKKINYKNIKNELEENIKRKDLTKQNIITIDPPKSHDFDDAISYTENNEFINISIHKTKLPS